MRELLYVPVIHSGADLGTMAAAIDRATGSVVGEERWLKHKETVSLFWRRVKEFLDRLDGSKLKIYQDGLPADGALGWRIIEQAARRGSENHQVVLDLVNRGAEVRKTEDISLLKEEHERIARLANTKPPHWIQASTGYDMQKDGLLAKRDRYIAETINRTLTKGETGILFIGAFHDVLPLLARDIAVEQLKDREKVRGYFQKLISGKADERFMRLAAYLVSPIEAR